MQCPDYVGVACVNGSCPNALYDEIPWGTDYYDHCEGCPCYRGCEDCATPEIEGITSEVCREKHEMKEEKHETD